MPDVTVNTAPYVEYYNGLTIARNYGLLKTLRERRSIDEVADD
jgi:hypothetical protein